MAYMYPSPGARTPTNADPCVLHLKAGAVPWQASCVVHVTYLKAVQCWVEPETYRGAGS
jgi:hypothetical protein